MYITNLRMNPLDSQAKWGSPHPPVSVEKKRFVQPATSQTHIWCVYYIYIIIYVYHYIYIYIYHRVWIMPITSICWWLSLHMFRKVCHQGAPHRWKLRMGRCSACSLINTGGAWMKKNHTKRLVAPNLRHHWAYGPSIPNKMRHWNQTPGNQPGNTTFFITPSIIG
jgi:hypothetical protein